MNDEKEMTALSTSVGADDGQSLNAISNNSITNEDADFNSFEEIQRKMMRMLDPRYLHTVSMTELYDTVYRSRPPLIDGLLYPGTYLFVGAPKLGKSFLMAQLAYHISTGTPLWNYPVRKGTVLYLALEDDYSRLQKRLYQMFGTESTENLYFSVSASQLGSGLDEQLQNFVREHPDTELIIIDTLQKVREVGGDSYSYANDYDIIARLADLKEKVADKQDDFKEMESRIQNYDKGKMSLDELKKELETSPDYALSESQGLMTAKSYKTKFAEPLIKKLKKLVLTVLARYFEMADNYYRLNNSNGRYYRENQRLESDNEYLTAKNAQLQEENRQLRAENKDFAFLRKMFGEERIDNLMDEARELQHQKQKRTKSYERG